MRTTITRTWPNGARQVLLPMMYVQRNPERRQYLATCGHCRRTWDDAHVSGVTPTPAGRCPFEYSHR